MSIYFWPVTHTVYRLQMCAQSVTDYPKLTSDHRFGIVKMGFNELILFYKE